VRGRPFSSLQRYQAVHFEEQRKDAVADTHPLDEPAERDLAETFIDRGAQGAIQDLFFRMPVPRRCVNTM